MMLAPPLVAEDPSDLPYMYAVMILHEVGRAITSPTVETMLTAAGMELTSDDTEYIQWMVSKLEGENIEELMTPALVYQPHPIQLIDDLLKPEPEPGEEEEEHDVWKTLFG